MSLLLQALKKAEEDKRRRADLLAESSLESGSKPLETEFPTLNLIEQDTPESSLETANSSSVAVGEALNFTAPPVELSATTQAVVATELSIAPQAMGVESIIEPVIETYIAPASEVIAAASEVMATSPDLSNVPQSSPSAPSAAAAMSEPAQQRLAKSLFTKSTTPQGRGLLPWLVLGAGLLLAGMLAWFTWQYKQFTQPTASLTATAPAVASAPIPIPVVAHSNDGYTNEGLISESLDENTTTKPTAATEPPEKTDLRSTAAPQPMPARPAAANIELAPKFIRQTSNLSASEPLLLAWQAYQNSDLTQAERLYRKVLLTDPRQRDAILGLAAIAQQRGDLVEAEALYRRLLRFNPQDEAAKAALLDLNSAQMPEKDAVQLEQSGKADPLVLGHYFAAQQRWSQAQEQFFLAYTANPNNADATLNLAVSLDHLNQTTLARSYYRKALQAKEQINFDRSKVEQRLLELDAAAEQKP